MFIQHDNSRNSAVSIVTSVGARRPGLDFHRVQTGSGAQPTYWVRGLFPPGVKAAETWKCTKVKYAWSYTSIHRDVFMACTEANLPLPNKTISTSFDIAWPIWRLEPTALCRRMSWKVLRELKTCPLNLEMVPLQLPYKVYNYVTALP
jgi:hypothetical protein